MPIHIKNLEGEIIFTHEGEDLTCATFEGAYLPRADFRNLKLDGASFLGAKLHEASFRDAHLDCTDFRGASLCKADLVRASLVEAKLAVANLTAADLHEADLSEASLRGTILRRADLSLADMSATDLLGADLYRADLRGAVLPPPITPPEGDFLGYKQVLQADGTYAVITLHIPADAERTSALASRKCRASHVIVVEGEGVSPTKARSKLRYTPGATVTADRFNADRREECTHGIHFFMTLEEAQAYQP